MPIVKTRVGKGEKFRCEKPEEVELIDTALGGYRDSNHDVHDFVLYFFGRSSSSPSMYLHGVKSGLTMVSTDGWSKLNEYVSSMESK